MTRWISAIQPERAHVACVGYRHEATTAQVIVAWHVAHGFVVIPKSVRPERIVANAAGARIELTPEEVAAIDGLSDVARR
jgi:diketogulonate reductase-like aldo/keto reductase